MIKLDAFRGENDGVNTPSRCVRVTHLPSGVFVDATEARSFHKNRKAALKCSLGPARQAWLVREDIYREVAEVLS